MKEKLHFKKSTIVAAIAVMSGLMFILSCCMVISMTVSTAKEEDAFDGLRDMVAQAELTEPLPAVSQSDAEAQTARQILPEYAALYEQNSDLFGWICIEGTAVDYPVMHTPDDPQFYLRRAFDKSNSYSGTPFLDGKCTEDGGVYLVHGHKMGNGTMFGGLTKYTNEWYWEKHPTIRFDTVRERGEYEIVSVFFSRVYRLSEDGFRYYEYTDISDKKTFNEYIGQVMEGALYDTGVTAEYGDRLLVLSTCNYHVTDGRLVVVARKKQEG